MRTIKFRGKRLSDGKWEYGDLVCSDQQVPYIVPQNYAYRINYFGVNKDTIGQFTGLYDKNGKEIYEGDIIDFGLNAVVKYHPFLGSFILDCDNREPHFNDSYSELGFMEKTSKKFVVIGNIHDNSELLKGGEKK